MKYRQERPGGDQVSDAVAGALGPPRALPGRLARGQLHHQALQLGAEVLDVAGDVRARVLRDRDDGDLRVAVRRRALRDGAVGVAAPRRPHDRLRHRDHQDGAHAEAHLRADGGPEVVHLHGLVRELGRALPARLPRRQGRGPRGAGRRLRARVPADARVPDVRHPQAPREGRRRSSRPASGRRRVRPRTDVRPGTAGARGGSGGGGARRPGRAARARDGRDRDRPPAGGLRGRGHRRGSRSARSTSGTSW